MITWTHSARIRLDRYFDRMNHRLASTGADPTEVAADLRRHIAEDAVARGLAVVTHEDVDRVLGSMEVPDAAAPAPAPISPTEPLRTRSRHGVALVFGVLLPALALGIEAASHMCAATFFDPIPTAWHALLVAMVPVTNLASWLVARGNRHPLLSGVATANGFAAVVAFAYTLLFLPLVIPGVIAILFFGWGFLPLAPLLSFLSTLRFTGLVRRARAEPRRTWPALAWGAAGAALALAVLVLPGTLTRYYSQRATSEDPQLRAAALQRLRQIGNERTLLTDCYGRTRANRDNPFNWGISNPVSPEAARVIYYQVTGRPFNAQPPPQRAFRSRAWAFLDEFSWDAEQAGTAVGGRVQGLSLAQSRLDALTKPDEAWSYHEWTLEFKNGARTEREARAQIALPPGGVVSRLTLWVNGEEREAAFAASSQVRAAYEQVVRVQRRDPVLVTACGPDRVLVQCYPVPRDGGTIKVRLGITAPLMLESRDEAVARWPHFLERNFSVPTNLQHSVWIESKQPLRSLSSRLLEDRSKAGIHALRGQLTEAELSDPRSAVRAPRPSEATTILGADPQSDGHVIRQSIHARTQAPPARVVFVIDGAEGMTEFMPQIASRLERLPAGTELSVLVAQDSVKELTGVWRKVDSDFRRILADRLAHVRGVGGQDNTASLLRAWDLTAGEASSAIVWVHGPQPVLLEESEAFKQRLEWRAGTASAPAPVLYDFQVRPGPNRLIEALTGLPGVQTVPRSETFAADLERLIDRWRGEQASWEISRERIPAARGQASPGSPRHIARLWAYGEVLRLITVRQREAAVELARRYQLVTPVSGAVVLETRAQFEQAGLQAVDSNSVPSVPEPGVIILLLAGAGILGLRFALRRRARGNPAVEPPVAAGVQ